ARCGGESGARSTARNTVWDVQAVDAGAATPAPKPKYVPRAVLYLPDQKRYLSDRFSRRRFRSANTDMNQSQFTRITNFIWGIADDVLRDVYVRGKYRDVILPMIVIRRLDAVLEPTKQAVLDMKRQLDEAGVANQEAAL